MCVCVPIDVDGGGGVVVIVATVCIFLMEEHSEKRFINVGIKFISNASLIGRELNYGCYKLFSIS